MRRGNGYPLCSGANNTCRHRFGQCPIAEHSPRLKGEKLRAFATSFGMSEVSAAATDGVCLKCGYLVHAPSCSMAPRELSPGLFVSSNDFGIVPLPMAKGVVLGEPPPGWRVDMAHGYWHFGLVFLGNMGCATGRCSCYELGERWIGETVTRYRFATREAAVAACWERHEAEQGVGGKLTAEACALRYHARTEGEPCPCGTFPGRLV